MANPSLTSVIEPQVQVYLAYLAANPDGEEIQYRTPLETLFGDMALPFMQHTTIVQEDRRSGIDLDGMPDFFVYQDAGIFFKSLVGFIECKKPSYNLEKLIESEQIKRYSRTCENIILTNYRRFILLQRGKLQHDITLADDPKTLLDFVNLLQDFYGYDYPYIKTKKTLVASLAAQSFYYSVALREYISNRANETDSFFIKFNTLFGDYEKSINYHYELADFCDVYSQSLVYGLLLAMLDTGKSLDEKELDYLKGIPNEYKLLYEFLSQGYESRDLPTEIKIALTNIGKNLNHIDTEAIQKEFLNDSSGKQNISVYLYEDFLAQYDKLRGTENRKEGGVYYTPSEASDFITRSVNHIIKTKFGYSQGYNAPEVKVLDFACGTGTFLHSVFEQMVSNMQDELQKQTVTKKITGDIYGFELLFTPYIVAHTILTRFLAEKGISLSGKRLGIYLANTLDISQRSISGHLPHLRREYETAMQIKERENLLAIIGNPPYFNGKSHAKSDVIDAELKQYKKGLDEKKLNLDDLYIKFIRFAEWKIAKTGYGIVGIITNNSFLDGVTHRQMRKHLYETFDEIYILNLHGNSRKGEADKNIFDIMVGVSITIFVKHKKPLKSKTVKYFSTMENGILKRAEKLSFLETTDFNSVKWKTLKMEKPYFWFVPKDFSHEKEYEKFWKITDIFKYYNSGIQTKNDDFVFQYTEKGLEKIVEEITPLYKPEIEKKYNVKDSRDWKIENAKKDLLENYNPRKILYRPFDERFTSLSKVSKGFIGYPRYETAKHFEKENYGLCFTRVVDKSKYQDVLISDKFIDIHATSGQTYIAPLYFYNGVEHSDMLPLEFEGEGMKFANFTADFVSRYLEKIAFEPSPEEILAYIYAVLHSPVYREKYIEFLKTDFPAVPMTTDETVFRKYAALGQRLVDLHLLDFPSFQNLESLSSDIRVSFDFEGEFVPVKTETADNRLFITTSDGKTITIDGVTEAIYNFEIGSYKPIEKWLKYRIKDEVALGIADLNHLKQMIIAIKQTIALMDDIEGLGDQYLTGNGR